MTDAGCSGRRAGRHFADVQDHILTGRFGARNSESRPSHVIFDIDGTLARTSDLIFASFNHLTLRHLGRRFEPAEIVALFGPSEEGAIEKVFGREAVPALMDELCAF